MKSDAQSELKDMEEKKDYFNEALNDFVHDMASGGQIRHLVNAQKSISQILNELDYHTPRERVEKTVFQYMKEQKLRLAEADISNAVPFPFSRTTRNEVHILLDTALKKSRELYLVCPFQNYFGEQTSFYHDFIYFTNSEKEYFYEMLVAEEPVFLRITDKNMEMVLELIFHASAEVAMVELPSSS